MQGQPFSPAAESAGGRASRLGLRLGQAPLSQLHLRHANMTWPVRTQPGQQARKELLRLFMKMDDDLR